MDMLNDIFALYLIDQAEIMITGEEEVLCGDETHFEATVKGTEASEYTITWQKRKGLITERIDTNKEKYRKSTGKKMVIQSMCKDDEGEYQAVLTKEINGNDFKVSSNKIWLHALGGKVLEKISFSLKNSIIFAKSTIFP